MDTITLKDREIPLYYSAYEMVEAQRQIAHPMAKLVRILLGRNPDNPDDDTDFGGAGQLDAIAKLICILGNAGLEESGKEPDLTEKYVLRRLVPAELAQVVSICLDVMYKGMEEEDPAATNNAEEV